MSALAGRRVVVTRARHQAGGIAAALETRGALPVFFPTITISPIRDHGQFGEVMRTLASFSWIVFTSANVVAQFWAAMQRANIARLPADVKAAAVGSSTAEALGAIGITVDAQPETFTGGAIAGTMGVIRDTRVLLPRGDRARPETARALRERGAMLVEVALYQTTYETPHPSALEQVRAGADAITFTSPSTVQGFAQIFGIEARTVLGSAVVAAIGPTTARAIADAGWGEPIQAISATSQALVECLEDHFAAARAARGA